MSERVVFREINKGEEIKACRLVTDCFNEFVAPDYCDEGVEEFLKYVNPVSMQVRLTQGSFILIATKNDVFTGIIEIQSNSHIALLFVMKQYQMRGIARRLLQLAIGKCRRKDKKIDKIDVNSSPYAVKIYEKLGFTKTNTEKLLNGIRFVPMSLKLSRFS